MKELSFIKENKSVCRLKFNCPYSGIPITDNVKVQFKKLTLTSEYDDTILEFTKELLNYNVEVSDNGFTVSLYFEEPENEKEIETDSINYQFGEEYVVDTEKSDIKIYFKDELLSIKWIPTIDDITEIEIPLKVNDDIYSIIDYLKGIVPNKEMLTYVYKDILSTANKKDIKRLYIISKL